MKTIVADQRLFWFVKPGTLLDLGEPSILDMYIQQVLTRGHAADVQATLNTVERGQFVKAFERVKPFLPQEVRWFWEDFFGTPQPSPARDSGPDRPRSG